MHSNQFNIFFVPLWGYVLNNELYHNVDYIEFALELQKNEPTVKKSNFGGYQSRDNLHKEGIFKELLNTLNLIGNDSVKHLNVSRFKIKEMWLNINEHKDCNGAHTHGGVLSGVLYLNAPKNCGNLVFTNPMPRSDLSVIKPNNYAITPQTLACIIFPSWLEHYVEPNLSISEPRISLSFNYYVEDL